MTCAGLSSSGSHRPYRDAKTVLCHEASCGAGLWGSVHVPEDRSCADATLRELVGDYQAVAVHPLYDLFVIAGQGTVMAEFVDQVSDLDIVRRQSAVEARFPVSVSRPIHSDRAWPSLPVGRPTPWTRWIRSSNGVVFIPNRTRLPMASEPALGS